MDARQHLDRLLAALLPHRCLLCSGVAHGIDLCRACAGELPRNDRCCHRCALPLAVPAELCGHCQRRLPPWEAAWAPFVYGWPLDRLETRFKFSADLAAGRVLATLWSRQPAPVLPDLIVPVPLHRARLRRRGYNQALELARPLARALGVPVGAQVLQRHRATAPQSERDARARRANVRGAFAVSPGVRAPAHVAVLDDVMTTGATLEACTRALRRAGVRRVDVWALARTP